MANKRAPRKEWSPEYRQRIRMVYGLVIGSVLIVGGLVLLVIAVLNFEKVGWPLGALAGGLILLGLAASLPTVFLPVLAAVLNRIPFGSKETTVLEAPNGPDDKEDDKKDLPWLKSGGAPTPSWGGGFFLCPCALCGPIVILTKAAKGDAWKKVLIYIHDTRCLRMSG